jgi:hypothetical protein
MNCILHPYGSSNYNTKACKHIKEKQHKHNKYVNVGEIFDCDCFMKVQTTDIRSEVGYSHLTWQVKYYEEELKLPGKWPIPIINRQLEDACTRIK